MLTYHRVHLQTASFESRAIAHPHEQQDPAHSRTHAGITGLGLRIAARLAHHNNTAHSTA